jgi:hypothetical protein
LRLHASAGVDTDEEDKIKKSVLICVHLWTPIFIIGGVLQVREHS